MSLPGEIYNYNEVLAKRKQEFMDAIKPLSSIVFYEFVERNARINDAFLHAKPQLLDQYPYDYPWNPSEPELITWIKRVLIQQNVVGDYLITFTDTPRPLGKVRLGASYDWIEPLWSVAYDFYFYNISRTSQLDFHFREGNLEANLKEIAGLEGNLGT